jgi:hypothetical protein
MEITFADSFWKSLKRLSRHQTWWYKTYEFFRRDLPYFLENIWFFRKELYKFRSWDYSYNLEMFRRSLEKTVNTIEFHGNEIDGPRLKKVEKMKRLIQLLNNIRTDDYISQAENELGELIMGDWSFDEIYVNNETEEREKHNRNVYKRANEIENEEWEELCTIIKGQNHEDYKSFYDNQSDEDKHKKDLWNEWYDGSGIKHWWD